MDIKRQFSLDYLARTPSSSSGAPSGSAALDEAIVVYSQPIILRLSAATGQQMYVHDLVRALEQEGKRVGNFEEFLGVINRLEALGFIQITQRDPVGNHLVHLLRKG